MIMKKNLLGRITHVSVWTYVMVSFNYQLDTKLSHLRDSLQEGWPVGMSLTDCFDCVN